MKLALKVVGRRRLWFTLSGAMAVVALLALVGNRVTTGRALNYGIDFTGGIIADLRFDQPTTAGAIRDALAERGLGEAVIRSTGEGGREFLITTRPLGEEERRGVLSHLHDRVGAFQQLSLDVVTPVVGAELRRVALLGVLLATLGMLVYISYRFEWRFGLAAIVALLHDVFLTVGFFALFRLPVDTSFIAAVLTVFGYSINDTIIVFDRIRENLARQRREPLEDLVDRSVNQVLTRSVNTVVTVLLAVAAVYLFGGRTTKDLSLALLVGISFGAYSSIFLASPLYVAIVERAQRGRRTPAPAGPRTA